MADKSFFKRPTIPPPGSRGLGPPIPKTPTPTKIGPYPVETLLDTGGMSLVYLGSHPETQIPLTIKVLSPKFLSHPEMTSHFLKEAEIIALADHPNIVKLYGYGEWEGGLYIAMEFVQGISLRQYLLQNPMSLKKALEMVLEIAYALCHLHTHGVIHRDLKPENILINEEGHAKVIDFGIAQLINPLEVAKAQENRQDMVGTPIYMSPEQRENPANVSYPSDIYSLGIITYELILGKLSQGQIHISLMPKGLQKILSKSLSPKLSERYLDIVDFISDLSAYLHSPQVEKDKKAGDQAGELFEKLQTLQQKLIPAESKKPKAFEYGLVVHRPLGFSAVYADILEEPSLLITGESSSLEVEGLLQLLYLKGTLDGLLPKFTNLKNLSIMLNQSMAIAPVTVPLSLAILKWDLERKQVEFLSCGYGPLWKISQSKIEMISTHNLALGMQENLEFDTQFCAFQPGDVFVLCPLSTTGIPFNADQFQEFLKDFSEFSPQKLAESLYRKAKSLHIRYFDEHPFVVNVVKF